jgi:hypothetical protein
MVDERRFFNRRGWGGLNKLFQSQPVIGAHPDHAHRDPRRVNPTDYRQPDVYKSFSPSTIIGLSQDPLFSGDQG